jgi:hypothetical protein
LVFGLSVYSVAFAQTDTSARRIQLPEWLEPDTLGTLISLKDLPLNLIVSPSKKIPCRHQQRPEHQSVQLIDARGRASFFQKNNT